MVKSNLRTLREKRGLSQLELANKIGSAQQTISSWENSTRGLPVKMAKKIADVLGYKWTKFYE